MKRTSTLLSFLVVFLLVNAQNSPNISRVIEYRPAPGQHINRLFPSPEMSDTPENALKFAQEALVDNASMLGLGAFGGYVIVGFDHSIVNVKDQYDFKALGNAFTNSSEPGVVMVCQDLNKNGKPDDNEPWYELAGSEYNHAETIKNYEITYYRPNPDGQKSAIRWTDNLGNEGEIKHLGAQSTMYPLWIAEDKLTFKGTKLRNTVTDTGIFSLPAMDWGYVDNHANSGPIEKNGFQIEWAVDADGNSVDLHYIDFIKIHTGQLQQAGWLGETSTEVTGIIDLHPDAELTNTSTNSLIENNYSITLIGENLTINNVDFVKEISIINLQGNTLKSISDSNNIELSDISSGIYILKITDKNNKISIQKFIKK